MVCLQCPRYAAFYIVMAVTDSLMSVYEGMSMFMLPPMLRG